MDNGGSDPQAFFWLLIFHHNIMKLNMA